MVGTIRYRPCQAQPPHSRRLPAPSAWATKVWMPEAAPKKRQKTVQLHTPAKPTAASSVAPSRPTIAESTIPITVAESWVRITG